MRNYFSFASLIGGLLLPQLANAACEDILRYVNYDTAKNYSSLTTEAINTASFCASKYDKSNKNTSAQIEGSYNLIKGIAAGSESEIKSLQDTKCGDKFGSEYLSSIGVKDSSIVSSAAVSALEACYKSSQFTLTQMLFGGAMFSVDLRWSGTGNIKLSKPVFDPSHATCKLSTGGDEINSSYDLPSGKTVLLNCTRKAVEKIVSADEKIIEYPAGLVTVSTTAGSVNIPLTRVSETLAPSSRLQAIEKKISDLAIDLQKQEGSFGTRLSALEQSKYKVTVTKSLAVDSGKVGKSPLLGGSRLLEFSARCSDEGKVAWGWGTGSGAQDGWTYCADISVTRQ